MVKSKAPECASARARARIQRDVELRGSLAAERLAASPSFPASLCFARMSFCCCRCSQVLADAVKSESFKQLHLDTAADSLY